MSAVTVRLPPYGRALLDLRRRGLVPRLGLVVISLDSWHWGKAYDARCVIRPDDDPETLRFDFVAGIDAWLVHRAVSAARVYSAIRSVLRGNPRIFQIIDLADSACSFFVKSVTRGLERPEFAT